MLHHVRIPHPAPVLTTALAFALLALPGTAAAKISVYTANQADGNVSLYDLRDDGSLLAQDPATVGAGNFPTGLALSRDGNSLYAVNSGADSVSQYDVATDGSLALKRTGTVVTGDNPLDITISPDGAHAYVTNHDSDTVSQYDVGAGGALAPSGTRHGRHG